MRSSWRSPCPFRTARAASPPPPRASAASGLLGSNALCAQQLYAGIVRNKPCPHLPQIAFGWRVLHRVKCHRARTLPRPLTFWNISSALVSMGGLTKTAMVAVFVALMAAPACFPSCPDFKSPCPKPFDVGEWCGDTRCELDGQPIQCQAFSGCRLKRGKRLSVPIADFRSSLAAVDLKVELHDGCGGPPRFANPARDRAGRSSRNPFKARICN